MPLSKTAVEIGQPKTRSLSSPRAIDVPGEPDLRLGQRAGLVGAEHVHGAEIVDGGEPLDDHPARRQPHRAAASVTVTIIGSSSGRQPDREREREQQRFQQRPVEHDIGGEHEQHQEDRQAQHEKSELANASVERVPSAARVASPCG